MSIVVEDFMSKLKKQTGKNQGARNFTRQTRKIEKLSLNNPNTLGRYQVFPILSSVLDFPFISGKVKQIKVPRKMIDQATGEETQYETWIHIPAHGFYQMKDMSGRGAVSSLTAEEDQLLTNLHTVWEELYNEIDAKNHFAEAMKFIRTKNYTLFTGYCLNFWKAGDTDNRVPTRQNFSALFMVTTTSFMDAINGNIEDRSIMEGGNNDWIEKVYTNDLKGRDGFLLFSVNKSTTTPGFTVSAQHEYGRANVLSQYEIPKEDFDAGMEDAFELFLGWQASAQDIDKPIGQRRLFNKKLMQETLDYMSSMLASVRASKAAGKSYEETIEEARKVVFGSPADRSAAPAGTPIEAKPAPAAPQATQIDPLSGTQAFSGFGGTNTQGQPNFATPDFSNPTPGFNPGDAPF